jgi:hypothetical protein
VTKDPPGLDGAHALGPARHTIGGLFVKNNKIVAATGVAAALIALSATTAFAATPGAENGPSSSASPYMLRSAPGVVTTSVLTVGDSVGGYRMVGIPDGLGAFDNGDGTFTLVMNHELGSGVGIARAHGQKGAFVSKWFVEKDTLKVVSGSDLIQRVFQPGTTGWDEITGTTAALFNRFCSGDLAEVSAFYDAASGLGTEDRIFLNGEESGAEGRAVAHVVTGTDAGSSFVLPSLGRFSWENAVAKPGYGKQTVVVGTDDSTPGQVYVYIGEKKATGNAVERAGLTGGTVYGVKVSGIGQEVQDTSLALGSQRAFTLVPLGDVSAKSGATLQSESATAGVSEMARPEDSSWDPSDSSSLYVATTNAFDKATRLWHFDFADASDVTKGGTATVAVQGPATTSTTAGPHMFDNITVNSRGQVLLQEDPGNSAYLAGIWQYEPANGAVKRIAQHDSSRFVTGGSQFVTVDEESSGIIPVPFLGAGAYLFDVQAHKASSDTELVEGGQLVLLKVAPGKPVS